MDAVAVSDARDGLIEPEPKRLYHSPWGLLEFQIEGVVRAYDWGDVLAAWDTGIGKTHLAMATGAMLFEDDAIDLMFIICEQNKVDEWMNDLPTYTDLTFAAYYGSPDKRRQILNSAPQVLVSTYETIRNDAAKVEVPKGRKRKVAVPSFLTEYLQNKRVAVVYDEITKLGNRGSNVYKAHDLLVTMVREMGSLRVIGLTGTPVEKNPESYFNLGRIVCPARMPTVAQFEEWYVKRFDNFNNPVKFKNLTADTLEDASIIPLRDRFNGILIRKRKTDPDVIDQFPKQVEEVSHVDLSTKHKDFYDTVYDTFDPDDDFVQRQLFVVMRQIAGHPLSLLRSTSAVSQTIVEAVGEGGLKALGAKKVDRLIEYLTPLVKGQGAQAVVFTFFGQSILPLLRQALEASDFTVAINHGQLSKVEKDRNKASFRAGEREIFLSSDAGSRGINLPEASYVVNYELPVTYANYIQRINRIHRIDSQHESVTAMTLIAKDTVENGIAELVLRRNEWADVLLEDNDAGENFLTAKQRKLLLRVPKAKRAS